MKRDLPPYVYRQKNGLYFQRRGWTTVKFRNQELGPDFWAEYTSILRGAPQVPQGKTFRKLIASYKKSQRYTVLKPRTKSDYSKIMDKLGAILGPHDPTKMQRKDVIRLRDSNAENYRKANYLVQVLRVLMEHAIDEGWRERNPAKGVKLLKSPYDRRRPWPQDMIDAYRREATGRALLVLELCLGTGQRIGDVLGMKWTDIEDDGIHVRQNKTGKRLWVPFTDGLRAALSATDKRSVFILTNDKATGPLTYRSAAWGVLKVRKAIGAEAHDIHALRHSAASELALAGCTDEEIAAITGMSLAMVQHYTATVRQKVRALRAKEKRK